MAISTRTRIFVCASHYLEPILLNGSHYVNNRKVKSLQRRQMIVNPSVKKYSTWSAQRILSDL